MKGDSEVSEVPLMEAARVLGVGYSKALQMVLTGRLQGERRFGRWLVDAASLRRAKKNAKKPDAAPAA